MSITPPWGSQGAALHQLPANICKSAINNLALLRGGAGALRFVAFGTLGAATRTFSGGSADVFTRLSWGQDTKGGVANHWGAVRP